MNGTVPIAQIDTKLREAKEIKCSRESCLALFNVLALGGGARLAAEVDSNAHEQAAFVEEVAGDVHADQQQEENHDENAHDGSCTKA